MPPPGTFIDADLYSKKQWRVTQYLADRFWDRWRGSYLALLQARRKWLRERRSLQVGDVVLLCDDGVHRNDWKMGRVLKVFPSADGLVRKVSLAVGRRHQEEAVDRVCERPVHKLVLLVASEAEKDA